jgi:hypothetical protein
LKRRHKKYARFDPGELMLVHRCEDCGRLAINRVAADDDNEALLAVFHSSLQIDRHREHFLADEGITLLGQADRSIVTRRLFGHN